MKHTYLRLAIAFMTAVALSSCRDHVGDTSGNENLAGKAILTATIIEPTATRTTYTDDGISYAAGNGKVKVNWAAGDSIRLYKDQGETGVAADTVTCVLDEGAGTKVGTFELKWPKAQDAETGTHSPAQRYSFAVQYKVIYPAPTDGPNRLPSARDMTAETFLGSPSNTPQMQDGGNNTMGHLAKYDMMTATKFANKREIQMQHEVAVMRILVHFDMNAGGTTAIDAFQGAKARMLTISGPGGLNDKHYQIAFPSDKAPVMTPGKSTVAFYVTVPPFTATAGEKMTLQCTLVREFDPTDYVTDAYGNVIQTGEVLTLKQEHLFASNVTFEKGCIYEIKQNMAGILSRIPVVDMGNGQIWATRNIGAADPYDDGLYFQWGETNGWQYNGPLMIFKGYDNATDREQYEMTDDIDIQASKCKLYNHTFSALINLGFRKIRAERQNDASTFTPGNATFADVPDYQGLLISMPNPRTYNAISRTYTKAKDQGSQSQKYGTTNGGHSYFPLYKSAQSWFLHSGGVNGAQNFHKNYPGTRYEATTTSLGSKTEPYVVGDAAMYQWGDAWHMPTMNQLSKLMADTKENMVNRYDKKQDLLNPNGSGTYYRLFTKINNGKTIALIVPNCYGWDIGSVDIGTYYAWYSNTCDGNNFALGSGRLQTTTAARTDDANFYSFTGAEEIRCWEYHFRYMNGLTNTGDWNTVQTVSTSNLPLGMHTHHGREIAVPIRPILKLEPDKSEYVK